LLRANENNVYALKTIFFSLSFYLKQIMLGKILNTHLPLKILQRIRFREFSNYKYLGISQSPFDLADKEVAENMSCTTDYNLQFEACMLISLN